MLSFVICRFRLLNLLPIDGGTDTEYCSAKLQLVLAYKFGCYIHADALRGVVDFGVAPLLVALDVLEAFDDNHFVDVGVTQIFVGVLYVLALFAVGIVGVLYPEKLCFVCAISSLGYSYLALAAATVGEILADNVIGIGVQVALCACGDSHRHCAKQCHD